MIEFDCFFKITFTPIGITKTTLYSSRNNCFILSSKFGNKCLTVTLIESQNDFYVSTVVIEFDCFFKITFTPIGITKTTLYSSRNNCFILSSKFGNKCLTVTLIESQNDFYVSTFKSTLQLFIFY